MDGFYCQRRYVHPSIGSCKDRDLSLYLSVGRLHFSYGIHSLRSKRLLAAVEYSWDSLALSFKEVLKQIVLNDDLLNFAYGKVFFTVENAKSCLIPLNLTQNIEDKKVFELLFSLSGNEIFFKDELKKQKISCLTALSPFYESTVLAFFPKATFISSYKRLLDNTAFARKHQRSEMHQIFLHFYQGCFSLVVYEHGRLRFLNTYPYRANSDILYYILRVLNKLKIDLGRAHIYLSGMAEDLQVFDILEDHILHIHYLSAPKRLKLPNILDYASSFLLINPY